jgi:hypothetical protein
VYFFTSTKVSIFTPAVPVQILTSEETTILNVSVYAAALLLY